MGVAGPSGDNRPRGWHRPHASFVGAIYAPQVDIEYVGNLTIDYDTDVSAPDECVDAFFLSEE